MNFAVFSHGTRAFVCIHDRQDPARELGRHELWERTAHVFHGYLPRLAPGALYGFRVDGPYRPHDGHRFNVNKLLVDPTPWRSGAVDWNGAVFGYPLDSADKDLAFDPRDSAPAVPKAVVLSDDFDWGDDRHPEVPWTDTIIYELHVRGFTMRHPEVPEDWRGTYAGLGHPAAIEHLRRLGITSVELFAGARVRRRRFPRGPRAEELLGLQHAGLLRSGAALCARRLARRPGRPVQTDRY